MVNSVPLNPSKSKGNNIHLPVQDFCAVKVGRRLSFVEGLSDIGLPIDVANVRSKLLRS